jgi:hypothetical protein
LRVDGICRRNGRSFNEVERAKRGAEREVEVELMRERRSAEER